MTVLGACTVAPVLRSGAEPGRRASRSAGRQGWAAGGLAVLGRGFRSPRVLVEAYRRPEPPYDAGPEAADAGATSMIDVSDGLVADAGHLAEESGVGIDLRTAALELPEPLHAVGAALGADPLQFILGGGDDHALLATFPAGVALPDGLDGHRRGPRRARASPSTARRTTARRAGRTSERLVGRWDNTNSPRTPRRRGLGWGRVSG